MAELDVVTGAFSYTGRHIAEMLLEGGRRVRTLTRRPDPSHPLAARVETAPLVFDESLVESMRGADTLYNTYWVRFEHGGTTFDRAVENIGALLRAATSAGVRRVVHISVSNPDEGSPFPYFRGKARAEALVLEAGLSFAIVRPTLTFGPDDILVNNIAWGLRHAPLFVLPGDGEYDVQPVSVADVARLAVEAGGHEDDMTFDAAGPQSWSYRDFVELIKAAVGGRALVRNAPPWLALWLARAAGLALRDVVVTHDELGALRAGLLASREPPRGSDRFDAWLAECGRQLGRSYTSELRRNFRGNG